MAVVEGKSPATDLEMDNTRPSWPDLTHALALLTVVTIAAMLVLGFYFDAPLKEPANPDVPENPPKAPWYLVGLQELVSYSALMGGLGIPTIALIGLSLIPYLDREQQQTGIWFSGRRGLRIVGVTAALAAGAIVGTLVFTVNLGWLRNWFPATPQIVITFINPGTLMLAIFALWSLAVVKRTNSTRMGALALFTCFLVAFTILTYFASVHRGPDWQFYWSPSHWPAHTQ